MSIAINLIILLSIVTVVAPPLAAFQFGRTGLRATFWAVLAMFVIHCAFAFTMADPVHTLIGVGIASLFCLAGILSVFVSALGVIWVERRSAVQSRE